MAIQGFFTGDVKIKNLNGVLKAVDGIVDVTTEVGTVSSVAASITGDAITISGSPITTFGTLAFTFAGTSAQYIKGDGTLATFPGLTGYVPYTGATANVDLGEYELKAGQLTLDVSPTGTAAVATTRWNNTIGSSETTLKGGSVILKNGVDLVARVVNKVSPNTTLTKADYPAVRVSGAQGQRLAIAYAQANTDNNSADTIGLVTETIATNQEGFIMTVGQLLDINTTGSLQGETWADGDVLYLSPTTAGALTNIKPTGATGHIVVMGYVEYAHAVHGSIYVKVMNGWELDELHNVYISSVANNDGLFYESATQLWKNKSIATVLGYTPQAQLTLTTTGTSGAATLVGATLNIPQYQSVLTNPITGTGTSGQVAYFNGTTSITSNAAFTWNNALGILYVTGTGNGYVSLSKGTASNTGFIDFYNSAGVRTGYIGYSTAANTIDYNANFHVFNANYNTNNPLISLNQTFAGGFSYMPFVQALAPNITNGSILTVISGGKATSVNNNIVISYSHISDGSTSNRGSLGVAGSGNIFNWFASGNVTLNSTTDAGFRLDVNGTARVQGNTTVTGNLNVVTNASTSQVQIGDGSTSTNGTLRISKNATANAANLYFRNTSTDIGRIWLDNSDNLSIVHNGNNTITLANTGTSIFGSITAASAIARGINITSTLVAAANNDTLVGLDVTPTFTNGAFTGVTNYIARFASANGASIQLKGTTNNNATMSIDFGINTNSRTAGILATSTGANNKLNIDFINQSTIFSLKDNNTDQYLQVLTKPIFGDAISLRGVTNNTGNKFIYFSSGTGTYGNGSAAIIAVPTGSFANISGFGLAITSGGATVWNDATSSDFALYVNNTKNILIGTTTDAGAKLQVTGSITAASAIARGVYFNNTLVAAANNDVLVGLDINPTFTNGAFTGVSNIAARILQVTGATGNNTLRLANNSGNANVIQFWSTNTASQQSYIISTNSTFGYGTYVGNQLNLGGGTGGVALRTNNSAPIRFYATNSDADFSTVQMQMFGATGNVLLQNGGTFTDAGFRLDVNGTARVQTSAYFATTSGSVGIGTTSPVGNLDVVSSGAGTSTNLNIQNTGGGAPIHNIWFGNLNSASGAGRYAGIRVNMSTDKMSLMMYSSSLGTSTERVTIDINGAVGIGTTSPAASSILDLTSTVRGFLPPRMTTTQKTAISTPATGLVVYDTTLSALNLYDGSSWASLQSSSTGISGSGTINTIPKFTASGTIGNSNLFDGGTTIYNINPSAGQYAWQFNASTTSGQSYGLNILAGTTSADIALKILNAAGSSEYLRVTGDGKLLIGTSTDNGQGTLQNAGSAFLGGLQVGGLTFSTSTTATTSTVFYYFNGGSGQTLTLPSTLGISSYFLIKNAGTAALTISRSGSTDTIMAPNGTSTSTTISLATGSQAILVSNGAYVWIQIV